MTQGTLLFAQFSNGGLRAWHFSSPLLFLLLLVLDVHMHDLTQPPRVVRLHVLLHYSDHDSWKVVSPSLCYWMCTYVLFLRHNNAAAPSYFLHSECHSVIFWPTQRETLTLVWWDPPCEPQFLAWLSFWVNICSWTSTCCFILSVSENMAPTQKRSWNKSSLTRTHLIHSLFAQNLTFLPCLSSNVHRVTSTFVQMNNCLSFSAQC